MTPNADYGAPFEENDDDLNDVTASPDDAAYECGWHDGIDYGYRLAECELTCPRCGVSYAPAT